MSALFAFTNVVLLNPEISKALLIYRDANRKRYPNLYTGSAGGMVELEAAEGNDIGGALLRECLEEIPQIDWNAITNLQLRLVTHETREASKDGPAGTYVFFWHTAILHHPLTDMIGQEGLLEWFEIRDLPLALECMTPTAFVAVPFVVNKAKDEPRVYDAVIRMVEGNPVFTIAA